MGIIKSEMPIKVLLVDDEENILRSLKRLFIDESFETLTARSGEEALLILKKNGGLGLIVSDQRMPGLKGSDFLAKAKEISPDALRIILTGYADIHAATDAINKGGAYRFITKPWKDEELLQVIREAVCQYSLLQENKRLSEIVNRQNHELKTWNNQLQFFVQEQTIEIQKKNEGLQGLNERLRHNFNNSILAFSGLLELRDPTAGNHSKNVASVAKKVATRLKLSSEEIETIVVASLLHDIGKIGIPDLLLLKDVEEMHSEELKEYRLHPIRGQAAIDSIEDLRKSGVLIRHHHEWHDGTGFPDRLHGSHIPLGSRVIAIADFADRIFGKYQGDNAIELTLNKVKEELGKRFDRQIHPHFVDSFKEVYANLLPKSGAIEMELKPKDLRSGMVLSKDVRSGTNLLLLSKGMDLTDLNIESLQRYHHLDPSKNGVFVWVKR